MHSSTSVAEIADVDNGVKIALFHVFGNVRGVLKTDRNSSAHISKHGEPRQGKERKREKEKKKLKIINKSAKKA
jgi:hypothetical protein